MRLSLNDLANFARCPKYYRFSLHYLVHKSPMMKIIESSIRKAYIISLRTGYRCKWKNILSHVDRLVFCNIDINNESMFTERKNLAEHILLFLQSWYNDIYLAEEVQAYTNILFDTIIGREWIIHETIPVVKICDPPNISYLEDSSVPKIKLYSDIKVRGIAWLVARSLEKESIFVERLSVGIYGAFDRYKVELGKKELLEIENTLLQLIKGIDLGFDYPSRTEQCYNCPFGKRCYL